MKLIFLEGETTLQIFVLMTILFGLSECGSKFRGPFWGQSANAFDPATQQLQFRESVHFEIPV